MPQVKSCCCCSLRTGTLITGYLDVTYMLFSLISCIYQAVTYYDPRHKQPGTIMIVALVLLSLALIMNSLMVYGAHTGKPGFMILWLGLKFLGIILTFFMGIKIFVSPGTGSEHVFRFLVFVGLMGLTLYLYLVVYSYYKELTAGPELPQLNPNFNIIDGTPVRVGTATSKSNAPISYV